MSDTLENHHNLSLSMLNAHQNAEFLKAEHCSAFCGVLDSPVWQGRKQGLF